MGLMGSGIDRRENDGMAGREMREESSAQARS